MYGLCEGLVECVWIGQGPELQCTTLLPCHSVVATTAALFLALLLHAPNPEVKAVP
jgi:hypothetical protein